MQLPPVRFLNTQTSFFPQIVVAFFDLQYLLD